MSHARTTGRNGRPTSAWSPLGRQLKTPTQACACAHVVGLAAWIRHGCPVHPNRREAARRGIGGLLAPLGTKEPRS